MNLAVFASGSGSNFQALVDAALSGKLSATIRLLVCDRPGAFVIERAEKAGIPVFVFSAKDYSSKQEFETAILEELARHAIDFIALAGYMRLIGETLLSGYEGKIVNIHPSLLPLFPGKDGIRQAFEAGVTETGVTIHYVDAGMDTGPIIAQGKLNVQAEESLEQLEKRIHALEHELYPDVLERVLQEMRRNYVGSETRTY